MLCRRSENLMDTVSSGFEILTEVTVPYGTENGALIAGGGIPI